MSDLLTNILKGLLESPAEAMAYSESPMGYLTAAGAGDADLSQVDLSQTVTAVSNELNIAPETTQTMMQVTQPAAAAPVAASAAAAPAPMAPHPAVAPPPAAYSPVGPSMTDVEYTFNSMVGISYEGDETIQQNLTDNSTEFDIDFDGDIGGGHGGGGHHGHHDEGEVDLNIHNDVDNATANGEGSVAAAGNAEGVATGDDAIATGGNVHHSQQNTGDGAVQVDGGNYGAINTGQNSGIIADGAVHDAQIGDGNIDDVYNSQVVQGDDNTAVGYAENVVSGDGNNVTDVDGYDNTVGDGNVEGYANTVGDGNTVLTGNTDANVNFGQGDVTDAENAYIGEGSNAAFGNGTVQDNDVDINASTHGSYNQENDSFTLDVDASTNDSGNLTVTDSYDTEDSGNLTVEDSFDIEESFTADVETVDVTEVTSHIDADHSAVGELDIVD